MFVTVFTKLKLTKFAQFSASCPGSILETFNEDAYLESSGTALYIKTTAGIDFVILRSFAHAICTRYLEKSAKLPPYAGS